MWHKPAREVLVIEQKGSSSMDNSSTIGKSVTFRGEITCEEDIRIDGTFEGTIIIKNHSLNVSPSGRVNGNVYAKSINIEGQLDGDAHASEQVSIQKVGRVHGDIYSPRVSIENGATLKGAVDMETETLHKHFSKINQINAAPHSSVKSINQLEPKSEIKVGSAPSQSTSTNNAAAVKKAPTTTGNGLERALKKELENDNKGAAQ
jgi:cytoskeletal protein CcmA (bactofilin family)